MIILGRFDLTCCFDALCYPVYVVITFSTQTPMYLYDFVNPVIFDNFASLFNCTKMSKSSDKMRAHVLCPLLCFIIVLVIMYGVTAQSQSTSF